MNFISNSHQPRTPVYFQTLPNPQYITSQPYERNPFAYSYNNSFQAPYHIPSNLNNFNSNPTQYSLTHVVYPDSKLHHSPVSTT
jgi:hypothetical protein